MVSVSRKVSAWLIFAFLVAALLFVSLVHLRMRRLLYEQAQARARIAAEGLSYAVETLLEQDDMQTVRRVVENFATTPMLLQATVIDRRRRILADSDPNEVGKIYARSPIDFRPVFRKEQNASIHRYVGVNHQFEYVVPVRGGEFQPKYNNNVAGAVVLRLDLNPVDQASASLLGRLIGLNVIGLLLGWAIAYVLLDRTVVAPVREISSATRQIAAGNLATRVSLNTNDELSELANTLNEMVATLQARTNELEQQTHRALEATRMKDEFLANMSHELRTPLNSVISLSELLLSDSETQLDDETRECISVIERNGRHLLGLISGVLDLARVEAGRTEVEISTFSVEDAIRFAISTVQPQTADKDVTLQADIEPGLPKVRSDVDKVCQILLNLVGNAVKFTDRGSVVVAARHRPERNAVEMRVTDTGIGIPESERESIFESFYQVDQGLTRKYGGTGLGLTIARRLASLLGTHIAVSSKPGEGSRFWFELPVAPESATAPADGEAETAEAPDAATHILVVEDNDDNWMVVQRMLRARGCRLSRAVTGSQAIEVAEQTPPDLVLMDIQLPDMDGYETTARLRSLPATERIPIIAVTAKVMVGDRERALEAGCDDYVPKPVDRRQLLAKIDSHLERARAAADTDGALTT